MIKTTRYFSFLLRVWQPENEVNDGWYASLEDPKSREVVYFKNLDQMFAFLREIKTLEGLNSNFLTEQKFINGDGDIK